MKESSKVLIGVGIGLIAGGVAGYFLASDEGQKFQRKTKAQLSQLGEDMQKNIMQKTEAATEKLNAATSSAKGWANEISSTVKQKISRTSDAAEDVVEDVKEDFQSGVEKARRNIENKSSSV